MRKDGGIGSELTTSVDLCPVSGSFPIQFRVLFVLSGHHSILRVIRFCCLQQCLDGEEDSAEGHGRCPVCVCVWEGGGGGGGVGEGGGGEDVT